MIGSFVLGKWVLEASVTKYRTGKFYFDLTCNINFEQDHCPMLSLNIGIGKYMFEAGIHYRFHRHEYDESPDTGSEASPNCR